MSQKVDVKDLKPGMYVEDLDCSWLDTPFLLQGILVNSQETIDELAKYCKFVYVSEEKSTIDVSTHFLKQVEYSSLPETPVTAFVPMGDMVYIDTSTTIDEMPSAVEAHNIAETLMDKINDSVKLQNKLDIQSAKELVNVLTESMIRNPEAMLLLRRLKSKQSQRFDRAINISAYLIAFGRHLCLTKDDLSDLGMGGLLMDIGVIKKEGLHYLDPDHVYEGEKIIEQYLQASPKVKDIVSQHHEHEDGSGFPRGLRGNEISFYGRMAAIVDNYELLMAGNSNNPAIANNSIDAINILTEWSRRSLNATLVDKFTCCIGLFPPGCLVELNTGEVGIVLSHNRTQRFLPCLMIILDHKKQTCKTPWVLDLRQDSRIASTYNIMRELKAQEFNINPQEYFL